MGDRAALRLADCAPGDARLAADLARCEADLPDRLAAWLADGTVLPLAITAGGERIGSLVLGRERDAAGRGWLIVHALAAEAARGRDVTGWALATLRQMARAAGYHGLRAWTKRRGLARRIARAGGQVRYVLEFQA